MRRILIPSFLFLGLALALMVALNVETKGQAVGKTGKASETKTGSSAKNDSEKKAEEKKEPAYPLPSNYIKLMKKFGSLKRATKKALRDLNVDKMADISKQFSFYGEKIVEMDKDKKERFKKKDYIGWAKDLQDAAAEMTKELVKKKPDWEVVKKSNEKLNQSCANCHKPYKPED